MSKSMKAWMVFLFAGLVVNFGFDWFLTKKLSKEVALLRDDVVRINEREAQFEKEVHELNVEARQTLGKAVESVAVAEAMVSEVQKTLAALKPVLDQAKSTPSDEASQDLGFNNKIQFVEVEVGSKELAMLPNDVDYLNIPNEQMIEEMKSMKGTPMGEQYKILKKTQPDKWDENELLKAMSEEFKVELSPERDAEARAKIHAFAAGIMGYGRWYHAQMSNEWDPRVAAGDLNKKPDDPKRIFGVSGGRDGEKDAVLYWDQDNHPEMYHRHLISLHLYYQALKEVRQLYTDELAAK